MGVDDYECMVTTSNFTFSLHRSGFPAHAMLTGVRRSLLLGSLKQVAIVLVVTSPPLEIPCKPHHIVPHRELNSIT